MLDPLLRMGFQSFDSPDGILLDKSQELDINQTEGHSFWTVHSWHNNIPQTFRS